MPDSQLLQVTRLGVLCQIVNEVKGVVTRVNVMCSKLLFPNSHSLKSGPLVISLTDKQPLHRHSYKNIIFTSTNKHEYSLPMINHLENNSLDLLPFFHFSCHHHKHIDFIRFVLLWVVHTLERDMQASQNYSYK